MSKYIKLDDAIEHTNQLYHGDEVEAWLESLPTIEVSEDCISREDLLNTINAYMTGSQQVEHMKSIIKSAPSVVPQPKEGEWINDIRYDGWTCSNCNSHEGDATDRYCYYCGAKMKGVE